MTDFDWTEGTTKAETWERPAEGYCEVCGGEWSGKWESKPDEGHHRAIYDGGTVHLERGGYPFTYRCRCVFGSKMPQGWPRCPVSLWERVKEDGRTVRHADKPFQRRPEEKHPGWKDSRSAAAGSGD